MISNEKFFKENCILLKFLQIYIRGDIVVLLPLVILIGLTIIISPRLSALLFFVYISVRGIGETMYWLLHQFGPKSYRPYDFGMSKLDNNAIYILYQTFSQAITVLGIGGIFYVLYFAK